MIRPAAAALVLLAPLASGCVALALPVAAAGQLVRSRMADKREQRAAKPAPQTAQPAPGGRQWQVVPGAGELPPPGGTPATAGGAPARAGPSEGMAYLYGSGEGAALSVQAYSALTRFLAQTVGDAKKRKPRQAVLSDGAALNAPHFDPCGEKPLAVVLDIDETAVLNLGYEADLAKRGLSYDAERWSRWEATGANQVVAVPGAVAAVNAARTLGITVIFNSNRTAANAAQTSAALEHAGLGEAKHGTTLWLQGDDGGGSGKDDRRWAIASGYCVIALVGDQLGDFSDLFNADGLTPSTRRALAGSPQLSPLWGNGWFMLPNPVYGTGIKGGFDDIFPYDMRWTDPAPETK